jgi:hypothetical protein
VISSIQNTFTVREQKMLFGVNRLMADRIYSLDEKWFVEIWIAKYYILGVQIYTRKKEVVKFVNSH